jgi:ChrR Cupin-like domain
VKPLRSQRHGDADYSEDNPSVVGHAFVRWTVVIFRPVKGNAMGMLYRSLSDILRIDLNVDALEQLQWRDFGNGLSMSRLAREGKRELVLYRIAANAAPDAFVQHEHIGGEFYLVLKGKIADQTGEYVEGDIVFLDPQTVHTPRAVGDTVVLVLWPDGVRIVG